MGVKNYVALIPMTSINSSTFTGSYQAINPSGLPSSCFNVVIVNDSTVGVILSLDSTVSAGGLYVPAKTAMTYDLQTNKQPTVDVALLATGTVVYVKAAAGVGSVYLSGWYNPTN